MFGKIIDRYCPTCQKDVRIHATVGYLVEGKTYFVGYVCPVCDTTGICKKDEEVLEAAKKNGKEISVVMH